MGASKLAVRNESELPVSVDKVNPAGITERAGIGVVEPLEWGRRLELMIVLTGGHYRQNSRHIEDGM